MRDACVRHLICVSDANHSLAVLIELHHLRHLRFGYRNDVVKDGRVYATYSIEGTWNHIVEPGDDLCDGLYRRFDASWVNTL